MPLKGDVGQIPLSNILQALVLNGQEGILSLESSNHKRKIKILRQGIRPINNRREVPDLLREVLLKLKILTEAQLQNILSTWTPDSGPAGDFLVSRRIVTQSMVCEGIQHQLENILLDVFVAPDLKYEFTAEADAGPFELFAAAEYQDALVFNGNGILMEAVRRDDEWHRIRDLIPSGTEVFQPAERGALSTKGIDVTPHALKEIRPFLNGENTVDQIVASTSLSAFETYQVLFRLRSKGLIKPLDLAGKRELAEKLRKSLRPTESATILKSILEVEPEDDKSRLALVTLLERSKGGSRELSEHYLQIAQGKLHSNPTQAKEYLEKVIAVAPDHVEALSLLFSMHLDARKDKEALSVARAATTAARAGSREAVDLVYRIVNFYPQETFIFHELADIHVAAGETDAAVDCLKSVAQVYRMRRDWSRLQKTCDRIASLKPSETAKMRKFASPDIPRIRWIAQYVRFALAACLLGAVLASVIVFGIDEYHARALYAEVRSNAEIQTRFGQVGRAKQDIEALSRVFPWSTVNSSASEFMVKAERLAQKAEAERIEGSEQRSMAAKAELTRAQIALRSNEHSKAIEILKSIDRSALPSDLAVEAARILRTCEAYFAESDALHAAAQNAESQGDIAAAHRLRAGLLAKYPYSRAARDVLLPVEIRSRPGGATVQVDGKVIGETPCVLRIPPSRIPKIVLEKAGFAATCINTDPPEGSPFNPLESHTLVVDLSKTAEWRFETKGSIEAFPCFFDDTVCFATRNGEVYALGQEDGKERWSFHVPGNMDIAGGLCVWNDTLYFGSFDGKIYALDARSGKPTTEPMHASPDLWPVKAAPSQAGEKGTFAVNVDSRLVSAHSLATGQKVWSIPFSASQVLGQPQTQGDGVVIVLASGEVVEAGLENGEIRSRIVLGTALSAGGRILAGRLIVGTPKGTLMSIDLKNGRVDWTGECGPHPIGVPAVGGDGPIATSSAGRLTAFDPSGGKRWSLDLGDPMALDAEGTVFRNRLYIGSEKGRVFCVDLWSGKALWEFAMQGRGKEARAILTRGAVSKGRLFVGAEDHFFYCLGLE